jgi:hypothetical protein
LKRNQVKDKKCLIGVISHKRRISQHDPKRFERQEYALQQNNDAANSG